MVTKPTQTALLPRSRPAAFLLVSLELVVALLAVVRSIVLTHVSCASDWETKLPLPLPEKKTVKIGVTPKKFFTNVEASKLPWRRCQ